MIKVRNFQALIDDNYCHNSVRTPSVQQTSSASAKPGPQSRSLHNYANSTPNDGGGSREEETCQID